MLLFGLVLVLFYIRLSGSSGFYNKADLAYYIHHNTVAKVALITVDLCVFLTNIQYKFWNFDF